MLSIRKRKTIRGRIVGYSADLYDRFSRDGATPREAREACEQAIRAAMDVHAVYGRRYVFTREGTVLAFYYNDGWCYDQAHADRSPSTYCASGSGCRESEDVAFAAMLHHACQAYGGVVNMTEEQVRAAFAHGRAAGWSGYCHEPACLCAQQPVAA